MCLLITIEGKWPDKPLLERAAKSNPDGIGVAYPVVGEGVQFYKGLNLEQLMEFYEHFEFGLVHFRYTTIGPSSKELCHPFPIDPKSPNITEGQVSSVLAHNGHWGEWAEHTMRSLGHAVLPEGDMSDSRAMAFLVGIHGRGFLNLIEEEHYSSQKIAVLDNSNLYRYGKWYRRDGYHLSNTISEEVMAAKPTTKSPGWGEKRGNNSPGIEQAAVPQEQEQVEVGAYLTSTAQDFWEDDEDEPIDTHFDRVDDWYGSLYAKEGYGSRL